MSDKKSAFVIPPGLYQVGVCLGSRVRDVSTPDGPRQRFTIGLQAPTTDEWGTADPVIIRISEASAAAGVPRHASSLTGRVVAVPVWVQTWTGKKGPGMNLMVSRDGEILDLGDPQDAAQ